MHHHQDMHPGYQYRLWTDSDARHLIASKFPWFLSSYDSYPYAIQVRQLPVRHSGVTATRTPFRCDSYPYSSRKVI